MRDERFKHIKVLVPEPAEMLFNLARDRGEEVNLVSSPPAESAPLASDLERFIQIGQHGAHVSVRGERPGAEVRVTIETDAAIASAFRFGISTGDVLDLAPEGKRLTLKFVADGKARHLVVQTVPPGADLSLGVSEGGAPATLSSLKMSEIAVPEAEAERLLHDAESPLRVWYLAPGGQQVELDEETMNVLRALGYIQ